jgi:uncharacterized NAD-dependent epimerase/dehydratase family protein
VVAVALNTSALPEAEARRAIDQAASATGLPAVDVVRFGGGAVWTALRDVLGLS